MSIVRIQKDIENPYTRVPRAMSQNSNLSWEARGLLGYLLSKPDGWEVRSYDLIKQSPAGEHVIKRIVKELITAGYMHREIKSEGRGKIKTITTVYESPEFNPNFTQGGFSPGDKSPGESTPGEKPHPLVTTDSETTDSETKEPQPLSGVKNSNNLEAKNNGDGGFQKFITAELDKNLVETNRLIPIIFNYWEERIAEAYAREAQAIKHWCLDYNEAKIKGAIDSVAGMGYDDPLARMEDVLLGFPAEFEKPEEQTNLALFTTLYTQYINITLSPLIVDEFIADYELRVQPEWIEGAIKAAVKQNVRKWSYIQAILDSTIERGHFQEKKGVSTNGKVKLSF